MAYKYIVLGNIPVMVDMETGYFNITQLLCGRKRFGNWLQNNYSKQIIAYLKKYCEPVTKNGKPTIIKYTVTGEFGGVYVCKEILAAVAEWAKIDIPIDIQHIKQKIKLVNTIRCMNRKMKGGNPNVTKYVFVLLKVPTGYLAMRTKTRSKNSFIKILRKRKYPEIGIVYEKKYNPDCINLFQRVKLLDGIRMCNNHVTLKNGYTIEGFIRDIEKLSIVNLSMQDL